MDVSRDDLEQAVAPVAPAPFFAAFTRLLGEEAATLTVERVGCLLAKALTPSDTSLRDRVAELAFVGADVTVGAKTSWLPANVAVLSPLIGDWISFTLGEAFSAPVKAAMTFANLAVGAPIFDACGVVQTPAGILGQANLRFGDGIGVTLHFGSRYAAGSFVTSVHQIAGDSLFGIGEALRDAAAAQDRALLVAAMAERIDAERVLH